MLAIDKGLAQWRQHLTEQPDLLSVHIGRRDPNDPYGFALPRWGGIAASEQSLHDICISHTISLESFIVHAYEAAMRLQRSGTLLADAYVQINLLTPLGMLETCKLDSSRQEAWLRLYTRHLVTAVHRCTSTFHGRIEIAWEVTSEFSMYRGAQALPITMYEDISHMLWTLTLLSHHTQHALGAATPVLYRFHLDQAFSAQCQNLAKEMVQDMRLQTTQPFRFIGVTTDNVVLALAP